MNTNHLKEDQILNAALGDPAMDDLRHAKTCIACDEELRWLDQSLANFRDSVHGYANQQQALVPRWNWQIAATHQAMLRQTRWAFAGLVLLLLSIVPLYRNHLEHQRQLQAEQDQLLLQQVDEAIASPVPNAMQPLARLANWNLNQNPTTQTQPSSGR